MAESLKKLDRSFYNRKNVVQIARDLLGKNTRNTIEWNSQFRTHC